MKYKLSMIVLAIMFIAIYSCQKSTQPTELDVPIDIKVVVKDQSGNNIKNAEVNIFNKTNNEYVVFKQRTNEAGIVKISDYIMPIEGEVMDFDVTPPYLGTNIVAEKISVKDVIMGCSDSTLVFQIEVTKNVVCGMVDFQDEEIQICNDSSAVIYSNIIKSTCPEVLSLIGNGNMPNVSFSIVESNSDNQINNLGIGGGFRIRAEFIPNLVSQVEFGSYNVLGTYSGGTGIDYTLNLNTISEDCSDCDCPSSYTFTNSVVPDTCLNILYEFQIDTTNVIKNENEADCNYEFVLVDGIDDDRFTMLSGLKNVLLPDENQSEMFFTFMSDVSGTFTDDLIYDIYKRNTKTGVREQCEQVKVSLVAIAQGPVCNIKNDNSSQNILMDNTLEQCPNWDESNEAKYLLLENTGACDLTVNISLNDPDDIFALSEGSNTYGGSPNIQLIIEPKETKKILIKFLPLKGDLYPNGCQGNKVTQYNADLIIDSQEENGCDRTIPLIGDINEDCTEAQGFKRVEWGQNNNYQYMTLDFDKTAAIVTGKVGTVSTNTGRDIYVTNINTVAGTAVLNSDTGSFRVLDNRSKGVQSICDWVLDYCNDIGTTNASSLTVSLNDVVMCYINGYHGLISISAIRNGSGDGTGNNAVEFEICYPID